MHTKYNIVLVEFDRHWDSTDGFCRFITGSDHTLTIISDQYIYECLHPYPHNDGFSFIVKPSQMSRGKFLASQNNIFNNADLIFINTIHEHVQDFLNINTNVLTVLRVHNAFRQFAPLSHIRVPFGFFYWRKALSYFIREMLGNQFVRNINLINQRIDYFTFLSQSITDYVLKQKLVDPKKMMFSLPLLPWEEKDHEKSRGRIEIVIVGAIERRKKDYDLITQVFTSLFKEGNSFPQPIRLNLLGKSAGGYGRKVIRELSQIKHPQFTLNYYIDEAPVKEFDAILSSSQIIISPLRVNNITQVHNEIYGLTKFSASIGTLMQFHAIGVFPEAFSFDSEFESHLYKYCNADGLISILNELCNDPGLVDSKITSLKEFLRNTYNKEAYLSKLEDFIATNRKIHFPA